jgi:hypothetical protein
MHPNQRYHLPIFGARVPIIEPRIHAGNDERISWCQTLNCHLFAVDQAYLQAHSSKPHLGR